MTQQDRIIGYVFEHGSITPMQAWNELGITKLSTRIGEIERYTSLRFKRIPIKTKNRFGEKVQFMSYILEKKNDERTVAD